MEVIVKFLAKSTIWVRAYVINPVTDDYVDPTTSIKVTIVDADGETKVDAEDMTKNETGIYDYYYTTLEDCAEGWWNGEVWEVDGTGEGAKSSSGEFSVEVRRGL